MNKKILSSISLFAIIPLFAFSMIFPLAVLSFSVLEIGESSVHLPYHTPENSSSYIINDAFSQIPSNENHPIQEYINKDDGIKSEEPSVLPQIAIIQDKLPEDAKLIFPSDLSQNGNPLINDTSFDVDIEQEISAFAPQESDGNGPLVLVLHTHATESFSSPDENYYITNPDSTQSCYYSPSLSTTRTTDNSSNVVHLGNLFTEKLNALGIPAIHCQTQHDYPEYNKSYSNSKATIQEYLEKYPSIEYVVDLHRDSIIRENGDKIKPICNINGIDTAQIMLVMGSGSNHPNWKKNLSLALKFKAISDSTYPKLSRPVYLRTWSFNQELCQGSIILEVGSCANSIEEAEHAAICAAEIFHKTITQ